MPSGTRCVRCGALAEHLDHIKPKRLGGSDDPSNLQPLCAHCHNSTKQAEEKRGGWVRGVDAQGQPLDPDHPWNREGAR
ncbi:HNH endonuclease [Roseospira visakhapatnamensis]